MRQASKSESSARCCGREHSPRNQNRTDSKNYNLLRSLIKAKDPETGQTLEEVDVATEVFAFLVVGSLVMPFKHIFDRSDVRSHVCQELDENLPSTPVGLYPYSGLESKLPCLSATMEESFRLTPVFQLPLPRVILAGWPTRPRRHGRVFDQLLHWPKPAYLG